MFSHSESTVRKPSRAGTINRSKIDLIPLSEILALQENYLLCNLQDGLLGLFIVLSAGP